MQFILIIVLCLIKIGSTLWDFSDLISMSSLTSFIANSSSNLTSLSNSSLKQIVSPSQLGDSLLGIAGNTVTYNHLISGESVLNKAFGNLGEQTTDLMGAILSNPLDGSFGSTTSTSTPKPDQDPTVNLPIYEALSMVGLEAAKTLIDMTPSVLSLIKNLDEPITIFVPTNKAFDTFSISQRNSLVNDDALREKLVKSWIVRENLVFFGDIQLNYGSILVNMNGEALRITRSPLNHMVVDGRGIVVKYNILCQNGLLHITDVPLVHSNWKDRNALTGISIADEYFSTLTMADVIRKHPNLRIFAQLFESTLSQFLEDKRALVTVFLPSDLAMEQIGEHTLSAFKSSVNLNDVIKGLIFPGQLPTSALPVGKFVKTPTMRDNGFIILVRHFNDDISIDNAAIAVRRDIRCSNGIIHITDSLSVTPTLVA